MGRSTEHRDGRTGEPGASPAVPDEADPAAGLERIRASLHRWLDRVEGRLADEASIPMADGDPRRAVRELGQRSDALKAEAERRDREWAERLEALEHDRRLLAEAWERLEAAQIVAPPARAVSGPSGPPATAARAEPPRTEAENPVDQAILRQFEALRRDVRRNAEAQQVR